MRHIIAFSGGKDSQATVIWALNNLDSEFEIIFCDTDWESPDTYQFLLEFEEQLQQPIHHLKSKKYSGIVDLAAKKGQFPTIHTRFCTEELKIKPMIDYLIDEVKDDVTIYQGIRHEESRNRAGMNRRDHYFKGYLEPYKVEDLALKLKRLEEQYATKAQTMTPKKQWRTVQKMEEIKQKLNRGVAEKKSYYTYRRKDVLDFCDKYDATVIRPIITWTTEQVFAYIKENGFEHNPLYNKGAKRVGCYPCVLCSQPEIVDIAKHDPERIAFIRQKEEELDLTFFPPGHIPEKYCSKQIDTTTGVKFAPTIDDVIEYASARKGGDLPNLSCKNPYTPCE
ncbi:MAG: phosphoadenosine phosphosulfate reductase family protein [Saprospiraceae bacterium]|nr:phosphoadenosine phosphosulfate reductase family protein [Saprospiraceae bacterium]